MITPDRIGQRGDEPPHHLHGINHNGSLVWQCVHCDAICETLEEYEEVECTNEE